MIIRIIFIILDKLTWVQILGKFFFFAIKNILFPNRVKIKVINNTITRTLNFALSNDLLLILIFSNFHYRGNPYFARFVFHDIDHESCFYSDDSHYGPFHLQFFVPSHLRGKVGICPDDFLIFLINDPDVSYPLRNFRNIFYLIRF